MLRMNVASTVLQLISAISPHLETVPPGSSAFEVLVENLSINLTDQLYADTATSNTMQALDGEGQCVQYTITGETISYIRFFTYN